MSEFLENEEILEDQPRPGFLTVLCVLSFISTGFGVISGLFSLFLGPSSEDAMLASKVQMTQSMTQLKEVGMYSLSDMMAKIQAMAEQINENFYLATIIALISTGLGLFSIVKMWKGDRLGFHLYIVYSLISIAGLYLYVSPQNIPSVVIVFNLIVSGIFILMYSRNLKWMV